MLGSVFLRPAQWSNCHIRDEAVTESDGNGTVGARGMHWTFASEALVWIPEQWVSESTCGWVSTCQNSWSEDERKKKNRLTLIIWTKPPKSNIYVYHKTQHRKEQLKPAIMITENLEIKEWRTYTNGLDTVHKAHIKQRSTTWPPSSIAHSHGSAAHSTQRTDESLCL